MDAPTRLLEPGEHRRRDLGDPPPRDPGRVGRVGRVGRAHLGGAPGLGAVLLLSCVGSACLEPLVDDAIEPARIFGDRTIEPAAAVHVEEDPTYKARASAFATSVAYLRGFADGAEIRYWNVDGPNATFVAPIYELVGPDGNMIGRRIIDVLPGDTGYSPWWRRVVVRTTASYQDERIWSREAIDLGVRMGILEAPEETDEVINCPVALRGTKIPVGPGEPASTVWGWYRNRRVDYIDFSQRFTLPAGTREMPAFPVYVLQRIHQGTPLYEFLTGVDLTGDGDLDDTNNIFASNLGGPRYSPLWYVTIVRTTADYVSIDNTRTGTVGLSAESDFLDASGAVTSPDVLADRITPLPTFLVNCPIQRVEGEL